MDPLKALFEKQFGTEWSNPVVAGPVSEENDVSDGGSAVISEDQTSQSSESEAEQSDDGPITAKHSELAAASIISNSDKRRFMVSGAPKKAGQQDKPKKTKEDEEDLKNDLELQRLIEESHILQEQQEFSGASISIGDPMESIGKNRIKILEARMAKAGAKKKTEKMPMAIAKGIKNKAKERSDTHKFRAKESGIVLAREKKVRKQRVHDKGLKINSVGKSTAHGVTVSQRDIARVQSKTRRKKR